MLNNIVEICVAIDIAILGIAYPIIVDKISSIGDKYDSTYLPDLFGEEFPQKSIKIVFTNLNLSFFKLTLYVTIISFFLIIFNFQPWFDWNNIVINNSAESIILFLTSSLTVMFFIWLDKIVLYNGKSTTILKYLIAKHDLDSKKTSNNPYYLKTINELTFYAVDKQDEHLQETLLEFYSEVFSEIRRNHDHSQPLIYPSDLYHLINKLNYTLTITENKKLLAIEHRAVSGTWLLGEDFEEITISKETYRILWDDLYMISSNDKYLRMYWATANQYFDFQLKFLYPEYNPEGSEIINDPEVKKRQKEREQFLEFNYALGGLLLYKKQYKTLKYIFNYSQSLPPKYVLLPEGMTAIFTWFEEFRNEFRHRKHPLDLKYPFPGLDNLGNRRDVNYWICSYIALLFIRQFTLQPFYVSHDFTSLPNLPQKVTELKNWLDSVSFFEKCLNHVLKNEELLEDLHFATVALEKEQDFRDFISNLKSKIIGEIGEQKLNANLSEEKLQHFRDSTKDIITSAFKDYDQIFIPLDDAEKDNDLKLTVTGGQNLMTKSAFTDNDIPHLNYDSIFAKSIVASSIRKYIPNSFFVSRTRRFLLSKELILKGIEKLIAGTTDYVIIAVNIGYELRQLLEVNYTTKVVHIPSSEHRVTDLLFILNKSDLPSIEHRSLSDEVVSDGQLKLIDENLKLYASIIDINTEDNMKIKDSWGEIQNDSGEDIKVQVTIAFLAIIYWKKKRDIVQLSMTSKYREQGVENSLEDIQPLKKPGY
ncbi:hypothetical protein [Flavobacterium sp. 102]|uniref:hypothetical protein n=1 Tax=Flavobacterium sp. 102 TaxID=2135623 RepID=UPI000EAF6030|nr:hypothetical protein [Flavobacterium sp. 102]RKS01697.1 hypothetical protein C8C84_1375 [Flavobacterium sp. 102]